MNSRTSKPIEGASANRRQPRRSQSRSRRVLACADGHELKNFL